MNTLNNSRIALALISLMTLPLLGVFDRPVTGTDVKPALRNSAFEEPVVVLVSASFDSTNKPHLAKCMAEGNMITITAAEDDTWELGPGADRQCNADGCQKFGDFGKFKYGVLKGRIEFSHRKYSEWFLVGTSYRARAPYSGCLYLACHDDFYDDNKAAISVKVEVTP